jgi:hypothetical protein
VMASDALAVTTFMIEALAAVVVNLTACYSPFSLHGRAAVPATHISITSHPTSFALVLATKIHMRGGIVAPQLTHAHMNNRHASTSS